MKLPTFKPTDHLALQTRANFAHTVQATHNHPLDPVLRHHLGLPPQPAPKPSIQIYTKK